jgi:hypothetical protein
MMENLLPPGVPSHALMLTKPPLSHPGERERERESADVMNKNSNHVSPKGLFLGYADADGRTRTPHGMIRYGIRRKETLPIPPFLLGKI